MASVQLHPLNMLWAIADPNELASIRPEVFEVVNLARKRSELKNEREWAVLVGALASPTGSYIFETEVLKPSAASEVLRPFFNTILKATDNVSDLLALGMPETSEQFRPIFHRTAKFLTEQGLEPKTSRILAETAVLMIHGYNYPPDILVMNVFSDGRLIVMPVSLLRDLFLGYLEQRSNGSTAA